MRKYEFLTDMAAERAPQIRTAGVECDSFVDSAGIKITKVRVADARGARKIGRPAGKYLTLEVERLSGAAEALRAALARALRDGLSETLGKRRNVLVVGLGNRNLTADSLGALVADKIAVNRHEPDGSGASLSAISPGVLGVTGIETYDIVKGVIEKTKPEAVVAVDSLATRRADRIGSAFQLTDTGIVPGAGVGNHRFGLSEKTLGVPVIAVGVPFVVFASALTADAVLGLMEKIPAFRPPERTLARVLSELALEPAGSLVVTPKDLDFLVRECASIIARAINSAVLRAELQEFGGCAPL